MIQNIINVIAFLILGLAGVVVMYGLFVFMVVGWSWLDERALLSQAGGVVLLVGWATHRVPLFSKESQSEG